MMCIFTLHVLLAGDTFTEVEFKGIWKLLPPPLTLIRVHKLRVKSCCSFGKRWVIMAHFEHPKAGKTVFQQQQQQQQECWCVSGGRVGCMNLLPALNHRSQVLPESPLLLSFFSLLENWGHNKRRIKLQFVEYDPGTSHFGNDMETRAWWGFAASGANK